MKYSRNWKDKLFINSEKIEELTLDISFSDELTYSITPKTLKKVTFTKDLLLDPIFTEEYAFRNNIVD